MSTGSYSEKNIYSNEEFQELVADFSKEATASVTIFSAFIKLNAIQWLANHIHKDTKVKIIARWKPEDLAFKASDLGVYEFCKSNGWQFGIDSSLLALLINVNQMLIKRESNVNPMTNNEVTNVNPI